MPAKHGYLVPEIIDPLTRRCVTIYVPDDPRWWAAFWGQMTDLANTWQWEGSQVEREEITAVWTDVLESARQNWLDGECTLPLEFRVIGGIVEYRPDASAGWTAIGDACPCPPPYTQPEYNPETADPAVAACNIAVGLIEWMMAKYNDTLDIITAAANTVSALDAILIIFPPAYLIADQVLDAIGEALSATIAIARAYDTVERRENMEEWLYCQMIETGEMTPELWDAFKVAFIGGEFGGDSPGRAAMNEYLKSFENDAVQARSRIESYGAGNCAGFSCGEGFDWEEIFDFTDNDGEFELTNVIGEWVDTVGWQGQNNEFGSGDWRNFVRIHRSFDARPIVGFDLSTDSNDEGTAVRRVELRLSGTLVHTSNYTVPDDSTELGTPITADDIRIYRENQTASFEPTSIVVIDQFKIRGTGTNPFA